MADWLWSVSEDRLGVYARTGTFALRRQGRPAAARIRPGDRLFAYVSGRGALAGEWEATSALFEDATALVRGGHYPHRVRVRAVHELPPTDWVPASAFLGQLSVLDDYEAETPEARFRAVVQRVVHPLPPVDAKVLGFLVRARAAADLDTMLAAYDRYLRDRERTVVQEPAAAYAAGAEWDRSAALEQLLGRIAAAGFVYQPWQVAAYVTALRTKGLVILAGVTGVGKSRLPVLVAEGTGAVARTFPVRPDWTDSADVLGYTDLQGRFRPGALLAAAREAHDDPDRFHVAVLDEANLARPEAYLAEVLSRIEARGPLREGGATPPLLYLPDAPAEWAGLGLPPNLGLALTVNMDESAHPFSRKVLDRAFTLELSDATLAEWQGTSAAPTAPAAPEPWPADAWLPRARALAELSDLDADERATVQEAVDAVAEADRLLTPHGLGVGYRSRDEAALFALHARPVREAFRTAEGQPLDPLDLALQMKLLPRIGGGSRAVRLALPALLGWALDGAPRDEAGARALVESELPAEARFPRTAARIAAMLGRLHDEGYASFWP